jgi:DNA-directed RNA polymerase subunit L
MFKFVDLSCSTCGMDSEDVAVSDTSYDVPHECPHCKASTATRRPTVPNINGKESVRDGYKRAGFEDLKKNLDLQIASYKLPPEQRGEIQQEIRDRKQSAKQALERVGGTGDGSN